MLILTNSIHKVKQCYSLNYFQQNILPLKIYQYLCVIKVTHKSNKINNTENRIMRNIYDIQNEIDEIVDELADIKAMTEDEVAAKFNVDSKAQIIERDNEILVELTKELGEAFDGEGYDEAEEIFGSHLAMEEYLF